MVFSSTTFLFLFLPITLLTYFCAGNKVSIKNHILLFASMLFYSWGELIYVSIMILSIAVNYVTGILIDKNKILKKRRLYLTIGVALNLVILGHFKYTNFIVANINDLFYLFEIDQIITMKKPVHLPIGISFFTFQAISYIVDVYRKTAQARKSPVNLALYISLFPQLIAGPIVRYSSVANQISDRKSSINDIAYGMRRFTIGLGKKVIIANNLGYAVDQILTFNASDLSSPLTWALMILYGLQIFYDFSGYSDMAIGLGRIFGFKFLENFNYPYASRSLREFWQKWHISLSSWFRDYLYIPLGGNKKGPRRTYLNLLIVFLLCGLWHGASWNFLIWGLFHGSFLALERVNKVQNSVNFVKNNLPSGLFSTMSHLYLIAVITFSWVFFRSSDLTESFDILGNMVTFNQSHLVDLSALLEYKAMLITLPIALIFCVPFIKNDTINKQLHRLPLYEILRDLSLLTILIISIAMIGSSSYNPFIYFQF